MRRLWRFRSASLGPGHRDTLMSMLNVSNDYFRLGRYADAVKLGEKTFALCQTNLGPDDGDTLSVMNTLAVCYRVQSRYGDALKIQQQALAVQRHKLGPDHPETLSSMNNLAVLYMFIGRLQDALKIHRELLSIRQAKLGPNHVETISSMANIAVVLDRLGRYPELRNSSLTACPTKRSRPAVVRQLSIFRQTAVEIGPLGMRVCQIGLQKRQNRSTMPLAWLLRVRIALMNGPPSTQSAGSPGIRMHCRRPQRTLPHRRQRRPRRNGGSRLGGWRRGRAGDRGRGVDRSMGHSSSDLLNDRRCLH